jgi:hypothetical protein
VTSGKVTFGRTTFIVTQRELTKLQSALSRIRIQHLRTPRNQPCCDITTASLVYKERAVPDDGVPASAANILALRSAEAILNEIVKQRTPDHEIVHVVQPVA